MTANKKHYGYYDTELDAALAYDSAKLKAASGNRSKCVAAVARGGGAVLLLCVRSASNHAASLRLNFPEVSVSSMHLLSAAAPPKNKKLR